MTHSEEAYARSGLPASKMKIGTPKPGDPSVLIAAPTINDPSALPTSSPWIRGVRASVYFFLILFVIALPHSIKGAQNAWRIAFVLWLVELVLERKRPSRFALAAPLLAYVLLSGISTALTTDPFLSWDRMKIVGIVLLAVLTAHVIKRLSQMRTLAIFLLLSGLAAAGFTAWQYTYGVGVQVKAVPYASPLFNDDIHLDDIITNVNRQRVHTGEQLEQLVRDSAPQTRFRIRLLRYPLNPLETTVSREDFLGSQMGTSQLKFSRAHPVRAQGTVGHYVIFAEVLMQIAALAWALFWASGSGNKWILALFAVVFLSLTAALLATETRAAMAGLAVGCLLSLMILGSKRSRIWATVGLLLLVLCATLWIQHTRHMGWVGSGDTGTGFRTLMWEDGLRLVRQHPFFGVGMETVRMHWQEWNIRAYTKYHTQSHFHSDFLQIAVERGLTTLLAWCWCLIAYAILLVGLLRRARGRSRFAMGMAAGLLAGLCGYLVTSVAHYNLGEETLVMMLFFQFGLAMSLDRLLDDPTALDVP